MQHTILMKGDKSTEDEQRHEIGSVCSEHRCYDQDDICWESE